MSRKTVHKSHQEFETQKQKRPLEEEVEARQICNKGTSLISQFFKTFTLDQ